LLKSPVRENRTPGSVRGRSGNWPSYRDGHYPSRCIKRHISKQNAARQAIFPLAKMKQEEIMSHLLEIPDELDIIGFN